MAGQRQPIELVIAKGNKHLTKAEIEARRNGEIRPLDGNIAPPGYLTKKQKADIISLNKFGRLDHAMRRRSQSMGYRKSQGESPISIEGVSGCEYSPTKTQGFGAECNSVEGSMTLTTPYIH